MWGVPMEGYYCLMCLLAWVLEIYTTCSIQSTHIRQTEKTAAYTFGVSLPMHQCGKIHLAGSTSLVDLLSNVNLHQGNMLYSCVSNRPTVPLI